LTKQELFEAALRATATVEGVDSNGRPIGTSPGALVDSNTVATAFSAINGASKLRVRVGKAAPVEVGDVLAWDRRRDWALVRISGSAQAPERTPSRAAVGTACATVGAVGEGSYSVTPCEVTGSADYPESGARLNLALYTGPASPGAPVLDEFGRLLGVISSGLFPRQGEAPYVNTNANLIPTLVIPIDALNPSSTAAPTALIDLGKTGVFVQPVTLARNVMSGGVATKILKDGPRTQPVDQRREFSTQDKAAVAFVNWDPKENLKGTTTMRLYDIENHLLGESKPLKTSLRPGTYIMSSFQFALPSKEGDYRVDVLFGSDIAWRGYFHMTK
jgi:hypothetical protein